LVIDSVDHSRSMIAFSILVFWLEFSFLLIWLLSLWYGLWVARRFELSTSWLETTLFWLFKNFLRVISRCHCVVHLSLWEAPHIRLAGAAHRSLWILLPFISLSNLPQWEPHHILVLTHLKVTLRSCSLKLKVLLRQVLRMQLFNGSVLLAFIELVVKIRLIDLIWLLFVLTCELLRSRLFFGDVSEGLSH
jgi:hypothetical protein